MRIFFSVIILLALVYGCSEDYSPKPKGYLALTYADPEYERVTTDCPYSFEVNKLAVINPSKTKAECMLNIDYPKMDGTLYISYEKVEDNLTKLLEDAQNLPLKHTIKADEIFGDEYENPKNNTYGMLYTITGNAASQAQFYLTDSTGHFMTGSLYFRRKPNYDSIFPAAEYLKDDMKHLMESLQWEE